MLKRTPLYAAHQKLKARLIEFGGWEMPVQYSSIVDEHLAVRNAAGLLDISHMGEISVQGVGALDFLNHCLTNDCSKLAVGQGQYTLMCNERGGVIDDLYGYRTGEQDFLLVVNASRIEADFQWLLQVHSKWAQGRPVQIEDRSDAFGAVALQGPRVAEFIDQCFPGPSTAGTAVPQVTALLKNQFGVFRFKETDLYIARTGYTGEDGFEILATSEQIENVWNQILSVGHAHCLQPAGLGARDTLRTEVCYPLYGQELNEDTTPIEAGLGSFVALAKPDFIGRSPIVEQKEKGPSKRCVAFKMSEKSAPPRPHYPIWSTGTAPAKIGEVSSGTQSPCLGIGIGMGYVPPALAKPGTGIQIEIRGKHAPAIIVPKPIYRREPRETQISKPV